jgi:hypothetical protein
MAPDQLVSPDEYPSNDSRQAIKNKPRTKARADLVDPQIDPAATTLGQVLFPRKVHALRHVISHLFAWDVSGAAPRGTSGK